MICCDFKLLKNKPVIDHNKYPLKTIEQRVANEEEHFKFLQIW